MAPPHRRRATHYTGPNPVVAHPPCARWGRFWWSDGSKAPGNDGGLFAFALDAVRTYGGVLEHPEASHAWRVFDLPQPSLGAWSRGLFGGWSTAVCQSAYGHRARKLTWLYYHGVAPPPPLDWRMVPGEVYLCRPGRGSNTTPGRPASVKGRDVERLPAKEIELTPVPFAEMLIAMAAAAR